MPGANRGKGLAELSPEIDAVDVGSAAEATAGSPPRDSITANVRLSVIDAVDRARDIDEHGCSLPLRIGEAPRPAPLGRRQLGVHPIIEFGLIVTGGGRFVGMREGRDIEHRIGSWRLCHCTNIGHERDIAVNATTCAIQMREAEAPYPVIVIPVTTWCIAHGVWTPLDHTECSISTRKGVAPAVWCSLLNAGSGERVYHAGEICGG